MAHEPSDLTDLSDRSVAHFLQPQRVPKRFFRMGFCQQMWWATHGWMVYCGLVCGLAIVTQWKQVVVGNHAVLRLLVWFPISAIVVSFLVLPSLVSFLELGGCYDMWLLTHLVFMCAGLLVPNASLTVGSLRMASEKVRNIKFSKVSKRGKWMLLLSAMTIAVCKWNYQLIRHGMSMKRNDTTLTRPLRTATCIYWFKEDEDVLEQWILHHREIGVSDIFLLHGADVSDAVKDRAQCLANKGRCITNEQFIDNPNSRPPNNHHTNQRQPKQYPRTQTPTRNTDNTTLLPSTTAQHHEQLTHKSHTHRSGNERDRGRAKALLLTRGGQAARQGYRMHRIQRRLSGNNGVLLPQRVCRSYAQRQLGVVPSVARERVLGCQRERKEAARRAQ